MKEHRIKLILLLVGVVLIIASIITVLHCKKKDETALYSDGITIRDIYVEDRNLTAIETEGDDIFVGFYNNYQPFVAEEGGIYYYDVFMNDSPVDHLYYYSGTDGSIGVEVPCSEEFDVGLINNGIIYGVKYEYGDDFLRNNYIVRYDEGVETKLCEDPVLACFFAQEEIYFQVDNTICLMDYNGENTETVLTIPEELYYQDVYSRMVVYNEKLWYCYDPSYKDFYYPLWSYDFDGGITVFTEGGLDKVNNGYFYYTITDEEYNEILYRFDTEDHCVEMVTNHPYLSGYTFVNDKIVFISYDEAQGFDAVYKMDLEICEPILYANQLGSSDMLLDVSTFDNRLFVTGGAGVDYTYLAEIDLEGNIINKIHEDDFEWYFIDEEVEISSADIDA